MRLCRQNAHLGNNLHIHPCNLLTAAFAEDTRPWEGSIITSYNSEFDNQDGKGHGVKLEPTCMVVSIGDAPTSPSLCHALIPWILPLTLTPPTRWPPAPASS